MDLNLLELTVKMKVGKEYVQAAAICVSPAHATETELGVDPARENQYVLFFLPLLYARPNKPAPVDEARKAHRWR